MGRVGVYLDDEVERRLKEFVFRKTGSFRGQSEIMTAAIIEYLDRHEHEVKEQGNAEALPVPA